MPPFASVKILKIHLTELKAPYLLRHLSTSVSKQKKS